MEVKIKCGEDLRSAQDWYFNAICDLEGQVIEVDDELFHIDGFYAKRDLWDPDGLPMIICHLDVDEIYNDSRIGMSVCRNCDRMVKTRTLCGCNRPELVELLPGSAPSQGGIDELIAAEFDDLLPNIK